MKLSSSGLDALMGGPADFFAAEPPVDRKAPVASVPRVIIASWRRISN
jgi:hypothetical protein